MILKENGVDAIELGIPFSDPVADGPIIERANLLSLQQGFKIDQLFELSTKIAPEITTYWMGYFNPFYHKGVERFIEEAKRAGIKGFIIPDLPPEEAKGYKPYFIEAGLHLIDFVAPTDPKERIEQIVRDSKGFIYLVAYAGITGAGKSEVLDDTIAQIKQHTGTPCFVGFGVSEHNAREKAKGVDGVIVGSAFIKVLLDEGPNATQKLKRVGEIAKTIKERINS